MTGEIYIFRWCRYCATGNKYLSSPRNNGIKIQRRHCRRIDATICEATEILHAELCIFLRGCNSRGTKRVLKMVGKSIISIFPLVGKAIKSRKLPPWIGNLINRVEGKRGARSLFRRECKKSMCEIYSTVRKVVETFSDNDVTACRSFMPLEGWCSLAATDNYLSINKSLWLKSVEISEIRANHVHLDKPSIWHVY